MKIEFRVGMIFWMNAKVIREESVAQHMIDMAVGVEVPDEFKLMFLQKQDEFFLFLLLVTGGIYDDGIPGFVPQQVGVDHEGIKCKSLDVNHKGIDIGLQRYEIALNPTFFINFTASKSPSSALPMLKKSRRPFLAFLFAAGVFFTFLWPGNSYGQFYNGSQLTFGKNRVQYNDFLWQHFRFDKFDTYFYMNGRELALYAAEYADKHIKEIETELQASLEEKIQFIIFNNLSDLKQSNIGLFGDWEYYNTGGVTRIIGGRVLLFFDGQYEHFNQQLRAGIAQVILNNMIYGTGIGSQIKNNALFNVPEWYLNGLISFISKPWDAEMENRVRDAVLLGRYDKFNSLSGEEAMYAGHSLWNYIAVRHGRETIPNIVYMARLSRNVEKGFQYVLGITFSQVVAEWLSFYRTTYQNEEQRRFLPEGDPVNKRKKPHFTYRSLKINPDGRRIAYVTHDLGVYKVYVQDLETGKRKRIYRAGYRLQDRPDFSFPVLAWHPTGQVLAMLTERKGEIRIWFFDLESRQKEYQIMVNFQKISDISYSDDGASLAMSAVQKGQSDIFVYNIASGSHEQITRDRFDDLNPRFFNRSRDIIFSSNRFSDTLRMDEPVKPEDLKFRNDLFLYRYSARSSNLLRLTNTPDVHETQPMPYGERDFCFLSDKDGMINRYLGRYDSTIAFIDTTTHYRYFTAVRAVTNYARNIVEHDVSPAGLRLGEVVYKDGLYKMYARDLIRPDLMSTQEVFPAGLSQGQQKKEIPPAGLIILSDSTDAAGKRTEGGVKSRFSVVRKSEVTDQLYARLDSANSQKRGVAGDFKMTGDSTMQSIWSLIRNLEGDKSQGRETKKDTVDKYATARQLNYNVEYYIDQMVTQIDFTYLNFAYQPFTGGGADPVFVNPGLNALFMAGVTDLMEDYRLTGGVRLNVSLINNEYLFSFGNYRRRIDHQVVFHRKSVDEDAYPFIIRHKINELYYIASYPFSPVLSLKGTASLRYDRAVFLSTDPFSLAQPDQHDVWGSLKAELTYDNTRSLGLNLYKGTRYKLFGEYYQLATKKGNNIWIVGFDIRNYQQLHRTLIWANRLAASTSFGSNRLLYYMGGVDNWMFASYNTTTPVDLAQNYAFQTLATNMRGFPQNIRNGTSFFLFNTELRWPVFRYFYNRPIRSDFINNFQLVAFGDVGTAWNGLHPWSEGNHLFTRYISRNPLFIKVEMQKEPLVEGFGFGARTRLFGYFLRGDLAWGVEDGRILKPVFYFSLSLDF